jgi:hypothetical protein
MADACDPQAAQTQVSSSELAKSHFAFLIFTLTHMDIPSGLRSKTGRFLRN